VSTIVYSARRILTMNPNQPSATHVAVRDGRILGAGTLDQLKGWGKFDLDERFSRQGDPARFCRRPQPRLRRRCVEIPYVGYFDRISPEGKRFKGLKSIEEVVAALAAHEKTLAKDASLLAWGFDPIYFGGRRMDFRDLDKVSTERPVVVIHSNFHVANANSLVLGKAKITGIPTSTAS
jgi:predicted amidohydrolase YtcJ